MFGSFGSGSIRGSKKQKIRDVNIELGNKWRNKIIILPHCVGTEPMDEKEIGFVWVMGFGDPTVYLGGTIMEVDGG